MSLRLISKRTPIGTVHGKPVFAIFGATPEGEDEDKGGEGGTGETGGDSGADGGDGTGSDGDKPEDKGDGVISKEEYDKAIARMKAADKNNADLQKKIKEYEDKDKSETERLTGEVTTLKEQNQTLQEENKALRFDNAFALQSKHSWQDPEIVLGLVRKHDLVTVEDDGTIKGLDKALDDIAKTKPFLLKDGSGGEGGSAGRQQPVSGSGTGSGKKNDGGKMDEDALRKKYPALNV